jgi:hypothetical protein
VVKVVGGEMRVAEMVSQEIKRRISHAVGTAGCPIAMTLYYRKRRIRIKMPHDEHILRDVNKSDTLHHRQKLFITQPIYSYTVAAESFYTCSSKIRLFTVYWRMVSAYDKVELPYLLDFL